MDLIFFSRLIRLLKFIIDVIGKFDLRLFGLDLQVLHLRLEVFNWALSWTIRNTF